MAERPPSPPSAPPVRLPDARSTPRPVISQSSSRGPAVTTLPYFQTRAVARRSMILISTAFWCGYDNQGNLFVDGEGQSGASPVELAKNAQSFETLSIAPHIEGVFLRIQWDGSYLTVEAQSNYKRGTHHAVSVNRLSISGSAATVVGTTQIKTIRKTAALSWIDGDRVLVPYGNAGRYNPNIGYWKYTAGGAPVTRVEKPAGKTAIINAITISKGS